MDHLNPPHGGSLINLMIPENEASKVIAESLRITSITLSPRQLIDLDLLLNGGYSPLKGFLGQQDYQSVLEKMRLADGMFWPIPIMLGVPRSVAETIEAGKITALRDQEGTLLAILKVSEIWEPDLLKEAEAVFGTDNKSHRGAKALLESQQEVYISGELSGITPPRFYDFQTLRFTPDELRHEFKRRGWRKIAAYQAIDPLHQAQREMTIRGASEAGADLLINPVAGIHQPGDIDYYIIIRCIQAISSHYPLDLMMLSLLNLYIRHAGPREALFQAIIRKNMGCSHFFVDLDHAGAGLDQSGQPFYKPEAAQELMSSHEKEVGIIMIPLQKTVYVPSKAQFLKLSEVPKGEEIIDISDSELQRRLSEGLNIPDWFSYPNVLEELRHAYPPKQNQGITLFFTGLPGAGKSTVANVVLAKFLEMGGRPVTLLDGDIVRRNLSSELGFSKVHRDLNIIRIGFVANEITKNGGIAICAPIAPFTETRRKVRELISRHGAFVEIYVATPLEVCEKRDPKGNYAKARAGIIKEFTGISDPYEIPENPEIILDATDTSPEEAGQEVLIFLEKEGYLA